MSHSRRRHSKLENLTFDTLEGLIEKTTFAKGQPLSYVAKQLGVCDRTLSKLIQSVPYPPNSDTFLSYKELKDMEIGELETSLGKKNYASSIQAYVDKIQTSKRKHNDITSSDNEDDSISSDNKDDISSDNEFESPIPPIPEKRPRVSEKTIPFHILKQRAAVVLEQDEAKKSLPCINLADLAQDDNPYVELPLSLRLDAQELSEELDTKSVDSLLKELTTKKEKSAIRQPFTFSFEVPKQRKLEKSFAGSWCGFHESPKPKDYPSHNLGEEEVDKLTFT